LKTAKIEIEKLEKQREELRIYISEFSEHYKVNVDKTDIYDLNYFIKYEDYYLVKGDEIVLMAKGKRIFNYTNKRGLDKKRNDYQ
jgi:hypothetical protein